MGPMRPIAEDPHGALRGPDDQLVAVRRVVAQILDGEKLKQLPGEPDRLPPTALLKLAARPVA